MGDDVGVGGARVAVEHAKMSLASTLSSAAVGIANLLRGRNLPSYSPQVDQGAFVVVINAAKNWVLLE